VELKPHLWWLYIRKVPKRMAGAVDESSCSIIDYSLIGSCRWAPVIAVFTLIASRYC
jgi:hypothetical protein